ncbi:MAG TPA: hypothetical protein PKV72_06080, partial [Candidatus Peribacteria bacterium]|nr:hypothetical protein [Candidatus Peribacteria bacterium]
MRRCVFLIGMAVLLAGCSSAKPAPAADVHDPSLKFTDVTRCSAEGARRQVCYDGFIKRYAGAKTTRELLGDLRAAMQTDPEVDRVCHSVAHAIGRLNFERSGNVQD